MKPVTIMPRPFVPKGGVYIMPDTRHPEVDIWTTLDDADALILVCHPDHEQVVRDAVAVEQERPKWWCDLRRLEAAITALASPSSRVSPPANSPQTQEER